MACAGEVTSLTRMREYAAVRSGRAGARRLRRVLTLASEHSWSPNESRTRMVWQLACRLPAPLINRPVFDDAGADHRGAVRHSRDVLREDVMRRHGLEVCHVTGPKPRRARPRGRAPGPAGRDGRGAPGVGGLTQPSGGVQTSWRSMPAARPLAEITSAILREASSIISSPSMTAPLAPPCSEVKYP